MLPQKHMLHTVPAYKLNTDRPVRLSQKDQELVHLLDVFEEFTPGQFKRLVYGL